MQPETFREICRLVKQRDPEVIIQISTGGRAPPVGVDVDPNLWRINPSGSAARIGEFHAGQRQPGTDHLRQFAPVGADAGGKVPRDGMYDVAGWLAASSSVVVGAGERFGLAKMENVM